MKPIGPLMIEHRLIERILSLMSDEADRIKSNGHVDMDFLTSVIDFVQTYTERTHFGKEEDILFNGLAKKKLNQELSRIMNELIEEHQQSRKMTNELRDARNNYATGNKSSVTDIQSLISQIVELHKLHIEKEDKRLFYPCLEYLSSSEQDDMLKAMEEFDSKVIHQKYAEVVEQFELGG